MLKMRKVIITESQLRYILNEEAGPYLGSIGDAAEIPGNAYGTEIVINNLDTDTEKAVTDTDNISHKKTNKNIMFARSRYMGESASYDNNAVTGFGSKTNAKIDAMANNCGGKMLQNLNDRINTKGKSQRLNTTQVEISRMEKDKKENPERFMMNGGKEVLNTLKSTEQKQKNSIAAVGGSGVNDSVETKTNNEANKSHHNSNEGNIYYY